MASALDRWRRLRKLKDELDRRGVQYVNTDLPTGTAFPDGSAAFVHGSLEGNVSELTAHAAGDGAAWEAFFNGFMANAEPRLRPARHRAWSSAGLGLGRTALRRFGRRGVLRVRRRHARLVPRLGEATFRSEAAHGLLAPWVLHTGLGPDQATSGFMTQVIAAALQLGGMPVPLGGGRVLVDGLAGIVRDAGGEVRAGADVERILVAGGQATGVRVTGGETQWPRGARWWRVSRRLSSTDDYSGRARCRTR